MTTSTTNGKVKQLRTFAKKTAAALFWVAVWQVASMLVGQEILVPSPAQVFVRLSVLVGKESFWLNTGGSLARVLGGFTIAVVLGTVFAVCAHRAPLFRILIEPAISVVKATPVASFIILILVWMNASYMPVLISMLMVLPGVYVSVRMGIQSTDPQLLEMAHVFRVSGRKIIMRIYVPSVRPFFFAACKTGLGLAWKAGVAAEVLGNTFHSIGGQIFESKIYLETVDLFAWTLVVIVLSMIIEKVVLSLFRRLGERETRKGEA